MDRRKSTAWVCPRRVGIVYVGAQELPLIYDLCGDVFRNKGMIWSMRVVKLELRRMKRSPGG